MIKVLCNIILINSLLNAVNFPIDAYSCSSSAKKLNNYADDLEYKENELTSAESNVDSAKSDYEINCGYYGTFSKDESMCGSWGIYKSSYDEAVNDYNYKQSEYNNILSDINYALKSVLRNCQ